MYPRYATLSQWFAHRRATRRPASTRTPLNVELLEGRLAPSANVWVTTHVGSDQQLREYTSEGELVQTVTIEPGGPAEDARGLVIDDAGNIHVFNGTNNPYLSTYDAGTGSWSHRTYNQWSASSNDGGLAVWGNSVFASDNFTHGDDIFSPPYKGIVHFDLATGTTSRFSTSNAYTDVTIGQDGKLYALDTFRRVRVFDPDTLALERTLSLPFTIYRGLAVDADGNLYVASWQQKLYRFDANGVQQEVITVSLPPAAGWFYDLTDIDISADGRLLLGSYSGQVVQMDTDFSNVTYFATGGGSLFVTFAGDDTPPPPPPPPPAVTPDLTVGDVSVDERDFGTVSATFEVTLSEAAGTAIEVNYATRSGTATADVDYTPTSGTLTFASGETSKTVTVTVLADTSDELDETFFLDLTASTGVNIVDGEGLATIVDDDAPRVNIGDAEVTEGNAGTTPATFLVSLDEPAVLPVTVTYNTFSSTAIEGSDFADTSGTLTFAPGETSKEFTVEVFGDTTEEADEIFLVSLSGLVNATYGDTSGTGTIVNDDQDLVEVSVGDVEVTEGNEGTVDAVFVVSLSQAAAGPVTVNYTTTPGTASAGSDYTPVSGTLSFEPGEASKTVTVLVFGDYTVELSEIFYLDLTAATQAQIVDGRGQGGIANDDILLTASVDDVSVVEGDVATVAAEFTVTLSEAVGYSVDIDYTTTPGSAAEGSDYIPVNGTLTFLPGETSKTIPVAVVGEETYEPSEVFYVDLSNPIRVELSDARGQGTISNDDSTPALTVAEASVIEGDVGTTELNFAVTLSNPTSQPVTVSYHTIAGWATPGYDYVHADSSVTIDPGQTSQTITITVLNDDLVEPDESLLVQVLEVSGASIADDLISGRILDDDLPEVSISDTSEVEGDSGSRTIRFTVSLSSTPYKEVVVDFATRDGTALAGTDYAALTSSVVFPQTHTSKTIYIDVFGELEREEDETFFVDLLQANNATIADGEGVGTIVDDDVPALSVNNVFPREGDPRIGDATFTVSLSRASDEPITVNYTTIEDTATAGGDFQASNGTLTFLPGETSLELVVPLVNDNVEELKERFFLELSEPTGAKIADARGQASISDDDLAIIDVVDASFLEGDSGTTVALFEVTLSRPSSLTVTASYYTEGWIATQGPFSDFQYASGELTFLPGETVKTVGVLINGDTHFESDEKFYLNLSSVVNATYFGMGGVGTILNDDGF